MVNCPKCGTDVREEKAFCHHCGTPMDAAMRRREEAPQPDFGATIIEPPRRAAPQPFVPPVVTEVQPAGRETAPVAAHQPAAHQPAARAAFPSPPNAQPNGKPRRSSRRIGFGFILLLLFLMFVVFVIALWLD